MPPDDRNRPKGANSSQSQYTPEFMREFPDDAACPEWLWRNRYAENGTHAECPKCQDVRKFKRYVAAASVVDVYGAAGTICTPRGDDLPQVVHVLVSRKHLQGHLNEYAWDYNQSFEVKDRSYFSFAPSSDFVGISAPLFVI